MNIIHGYGSTSGGEASNILQHRQISSTTRPSSMMRTAEQLYEMIDQIGKGKLTKNLLSFWGNSQKNLKISQIAKI